MRWSSWRSGAAGMGIQGVPFFILLGKYGISGAQPPEFWREALPKIAAEAASRRRSLQPAS